LNRYIDYLFVAFLYSLQSNKSDVFRSFVTKHLHHSHDRGANFRNSWSRIWGKCYYKG